MLLRKGIRINARAPEAIPKANFYSAPNCASSWMSVVGFYSLASLQIRFKTNIIWETEWNLPLSCLLISTVCRTCDVTKPVEGDTIPLNAELPRSELQGRSLSPPRRNLIHNKEETGRNGLFALFLEKNTSQETEFVFLSCLSGGVGSKADLTTVIWKKYVHKESNLIQIIFPSILF